MKKNGGSSFRQALADVSPAVRILSDCELRAFGVAVLAEMARREGTNMAATWAADQATRLRCIDAVTIEPEKETTR